MTDSRRQFRTLYRDFLKRIVDAEVLSAGGDPSKLLVQFAALLGSLSFVLTVYLVPAYANLGRSLDPIASGSWGGAEFLIGTTMAIAGMIAVISWDSIFPDRKDALVLGLLPVGARTIFRAKAAAIATALGVGMAALNFATGLSYPFVAAEPSFAAVLRAFFAYWVTIAAAGLFVFSTLLGVQGLAAQVLSYRTFLRVSSFLQLAAFFLVLGVYFLTPGPSDVSLTPTDAGMMSRLPSFWFMGLYQVLKGASAPIFATLAMRAVIGLLVAITVAGTTFALMYFRNMRRMIEQPDITSADRSRPAARLTTWITARFFEKPIERAVILFTARTLARSRQHRVMLAFYGGVGLAISLTYAKGMLYGFTANRWYEPNIPFRIAGFVMLFFAVIGLRAVFSLPVSLKSNWIFKLTAVHSPKAYFMAVRRSLYGFAALPVWIVAAVAYLAIWERIPAILHLAVMAAIGVVLVERALIEFRKVPFTCSYLPGRSNMRFFLAVYGIAFLFLVYIGTSIESELVKTGSRSIFLFAVLTIVTLRARQRWRGFAGGPLERLQFEDVADVEVSPLDLHDGSVYSRAEQYIDVVNAPPEPTLKQRALRRVRRAAIVMVSFTAAGVIYEQVSMRLNPVPPVTGTLVDVGERRLNIFCSGEGSPTVIFESGRGGTGIEWTRIQREIAMLTRACWYDRAGYGWSDPAPLLHPASAVADDLHKLVQGFGVAPPYVLVGASFGGIDVRVYGKMFPRDVAGMVLVDSTHVDERQPITPPGGGYLPYFPRLLPAVAQILKHTGALRLLVNLPRTPFEPRTFAEAIKELDYESLLEARSVRSLGDIPLIVLTATEHSTSAPESLFEVRRRRTAEAAWVEAQKQLAGLSTRGRQIVLPDTKHGIQYYRPDVVIQAIKDVVGEVRSPSGAAISTIRY
jgi:pimeloyl-ACP methyl ester carboxylesterase